MRSAECWVSLLALSTTPDNLININHCHVVFPYAELNLLLAPLLKSLPTREVFDAESKDASNLQSLEVLRVRDAEPETRASLRGRRDQSHPHLYSVVQLLLQHVWPRSASTFTLTIRAEKTILGLRLQPKRFHAVLRARQVR